MRNATAAVLMLIGIVLMIFGAYTVHPGWAVFAIGGGVAGLGKGLLSED